MDALRFDYTNWSHQNHLNVIPEADFKRLINDAFNSIVQVLQETYGPYGSSVMISDLSEMTTTKDGYNVFHALNFSHSYKRIVYHALRDIINRVNRTVGDGTTSCILLAAKMFNVLDKSISTADEKRHVLEMLTNIEEELQKPTKINDDIKNGSVKKLTAESMLNMIRLAANYDEHLSHVVYDSLAPSFDENGFVTEIRNVVPCSELNLEANSNAQYDIDYIPGDYRINANMDIDDISSFDEKTTCKCVIYDHMFTSSDWNGFMKNYKNEPTLIIAKNFTQGFLDQDYVQYIQDLAIKKKLKMDNKAWEKTIYLCKIEGNYLQNEIADLAAVVGTSAVGMYNNEINHNELKVVTFSVFKNKALCFYNLTGDASHYIEKLEDALTKETSYIKQRDIKTRIKAIKMNTKDTDLTYHCGTSLEAKLIGDKIMDCISIVSSAVYFGIVPNMLRYGYNRIKTLETSETKIVTDSICDSIIGLFNTIWKSKYNETESAEYQKTKEDIINKYESYNIITNKFIPFEDLPTSAQYDLEVIVASISIVKYLLTSRALIFDAHLQTTVNDEAYKVQ